jgi:hypothetical protein
MASNVLSAFVAAAVAIEARHGLKRTDFQRLAEHVAGWRRSFASVASVVSEHDIVLMRDDWVPKSMTPKATPEAGSQGAQY